MFKPDSSSYGVKMFCIKNCSLKVMLLLFSGLLPGAGYDVRAFPQQTDLWAKHPVATTDDFHRGFFLNDSNGWLVTHSTGLILRTTDGGTSWQAQTKFETGYLESIFFVDKRQGWICGDKGRIYRTQDGGENWQQVGQNKPELVFTGIHFFNRKQGLIVGMNVQSRQSLLFESSDSGRSWQDCSTKVSGTGLSGVIKFLNKKIGFLAGFNSLFRTTDGGRSWQALNIGQGVVIRDIVFLNESTGWAVGHKGLLLSTDDQGQSWKRSNSFSEALLRSAVFINQNVGFLAGDKDSNGNSLWQTNDGGKNWHKVQQDFPDIHQIIQTKKRLYLIGDSGSILSRKLGRT
jgi:photosystem II stability/assembly factor-like uncharacterized protein